MKGGDLRNRLRVIRDMDVRRGAAAVVPAARKEAAPPPVKAAVSDNAPPGWESAGFLTARRELTLDFPHALPAAFPRSMGIPAPDFFDYFSAAEGKAAPGDLLFFDLETTGLSSGAGTVAFLAAFGRFVPAAGNAPYRLLVTQYLLLDYPGENDFLEAALKEFAVSGAGRPPLVVTYNGKTFDAQILKTRCLMNAIPPLDYLHADLLHPARRLWKRVLPSCSQASIETSVLGLDRSDDIPGSQAPDIWFDFLKTGRTEALYGICDHNVKDIYGLARLLSAMAEIARSPLAALEKYRCDAERLALRWWRACREERLGAETPMGGDDFERGKLLLDYAAEKGWKKAMLVRMMDAEWRLKDAAKALAFVDAALALETVQQVRAPEPGAHPVTEAVPLPDEFRAALLHRRERLLRKTGNREQGTGNSGAIFCECYAGVSSVYAV
jgi:uncharacterized protein YprB with RNaseH-like and TPR domain